MNGGDHRQRWAAIVLAGFVFGAAMFAAGRATAPDPVGASVTDVASTVETTGESVGGNDDAATGASDDQSASGSDDRVGEAVVSSAPVLPPGCDPVSYSTIGLSELPAEAFDTIVNINDGPPFPYRQDDGVFQNREGRLPDRERGYYREYTVETPGSDDRGARRIVTGDCGEFYYTGDHYDSFDLIDLDE